MALAAAAAVPLGTVLVGPASATTYTVTVTADDGTGSLRQALVDAAANPGDDVIDITAGLGTITINSEIFWSANDAVTINGNGATLTGPGVGRGLVVRQGGHVTINDLTITGFGAATGGGDNAPVVASGGVTLTGCSITGNNITTDEGDIAGGVLSEVGTVSIDSLHHHREQAPPRPVATRAVAVPSRSQARLSIATSTISGNTASTEPRRRRWCLDRTWADPK